MHQDNSKKACSLICNFCNEAIQTRLENDSKFEEGIKGDPFKIMMPMKQKMLFEQLERLLSTKQQEEEPLIEHAKRLEQAQNDVKSIVGTAWLHKFVKNAEECINEAQDNVKKNSKKAVTSHSWHVHF